jgi:Protein of unknown function (DUF2637)
MSAANRVQALTRGVAVTVMAVAVVTATAGGFAQSYSGLYNWALEHGLTGWKAESFPLLVDLFVIVGELGLFLLAIDAFVLHRRHLLSWVDFCLPLFIATAGWTASLIFNVGHVVNRQFSYQATAAVPPIVSMLGLFVLLRTLHRYVSPPMEPEEAEPDPKAIEAPRPATSISLHQITIVPMRIAPQPLAAAEPAIEAGSPAEPVLKATAIAVDKPVSVNGQTSSSNGKHAAPPPPAPAPAPQPEPEPVSVPVAQPDPDALRGILMESLGRHNGDVYQTLDELMAEGYALTTEEVRKARENHWFPYAVFRLLAKHDGDGALVGKELTEQAIEYDNSSLDDLVRNWRA